MKRIIAIIAGLGATLFLYLAFVHYQEPNESALVWNRIRGTFRLEKVAGFHFSPPWVGAAIIDLRPMRVCVTSSSRSFNCKLVEFNPDAYKEFVALEGTRYYWLSNRISFNSGYDEEYRGMRDVLRGYTYSIKKYSFVRVVRDYEE